MPQAHYSPNTTPAHCCSAVEQGHTHAWPGHGTRRARSDAGGPSQLGGEGAAAAAAGLGVGVGRHLEGRAHEVVLKLHHRTCSQGSSQRQPHHHTRVMAQGAAVMHALPPPTAAPPLSPSSCPPRRASPRTNSNDTGSHTTCTPSSEKNTLQPRSQHEIHTSCWLSPCPATAT